MLGGSYRASFRPLNDAIMTGRIRGVAAIVGCNNPRSSQDYLHNHGRTRTAQAGCARRADRLRRDRRGQAGAAAGRSGSRPRSEAACAKSAKRSASRPCCTWARAWTIPAS
ncbi:MAG: hypothetical protein MZV64_35080 [Ignavibacteriales bacterium]|nr:hypothetical protein [Ignavibacteriales bacterium]